MVANQEKTLYTTYNPQNDIEQSTALRMQTIASLYNITVELPARAYTKENVLSLETTQRIERCGFVLALSLNKMSATIRAELQHAVSQNKPIIVIYDKKVGKTIDFKNYAHVKEVYIDFNNTEIALREIADFLQKDSVTPAHTHNVLTKNDSALGIALGVINIVLGLLALWSLGRE